MKISRREVFAGAWRSKASSYKTYRKKDSSCYICMDFNQELYQFYQQPSVSLKLETTKIIT